MSLWVEFVAGFCLLFPLFFRVVSLKNISFIMHIYLFIYLFIYSCTYAVCFGRKHRLCCKSFVIFLIPYAF